MAAASRLGDICSGHGCFPPRAGKDAASTVFINGIQAHKYGDPWDVHCCPGAGCHPSIIGGGSGSVTIEKAPAARIGDSIACGSVIAQGSSNVFIGG
jgi:uncharacterized Zn-binding protein involved in type VI secretion